MDGAIKFTKLVYSGCLQWLFTVVNWMWMQAEAVVTREAEFAGPAWMFGSRSYQVLPDGRSVHQPNIQS